MRACFNVRPAVHRRQQERQNSENCEYGRGLQGGIAHSGAQPVCLLAGIVDKRCDDRRPGLSTVLDGRCESLQSPVLLFLVTLLVAVLGPLRATDSEPSERNQASSEAQPARRARACGKDGTL